MISPADGQKYAAQIREVYDNAERLVLQKIAQRVAKDGSIADDHWLKRKEAEIARNRAEITKILNRFAVDGPKAVQDLIVQGYLSGILSADGDLVDAGAKMIEKPISFKPSKLGEAVSVTGTFGAIHTSAIHSLVAATQGGLSGAHVMMVRQAQDAYRDIITRIAPDAVAGVETRLQATQRALIDFADKGIGVFTDRSGKNWDIATYAEMATRTGMAQAHIQGHINRLTEQGYDLVIVSHHPEPSDLCRPHEGKVFSISGKDTRYPKLSWAISTGLFHPNCRHTINAYIEGLTDTPEIHADPDGYKKRQKQRYLERQVRYWKKRQIVAITSKEKLLADTKIKQWSQVLNKYVRETGGIRDYSRTRVYRDTIGKGSAPTGTVPNINPAAEVGKLARDAKDDIKDAATDIKSGNIVSPKTADDIWSIAAKYDNPSDFMREIFGNQDMMKQFRELSTSGYKGDAIATFDALKKGPSGSTFKAVSEPEAPRVTKPKRESKPKSAKPTKPVEPPPTSGIEGVSVNLIDRKKPIIDKAAGKMTKTDKMALRSLSPRYEALADVDGIDRSIATKILKYVNSGTPLDKWDVDTLKWRLTFMKPEKRRLFTDGGAIDGRLINPDITSDISQNAAHGLTRQASEVTAMKTSIVSRLIEDTTDWEKQRKLRLGPNDKLVDEKMDAAIREAEDIIRRNEVGPNSTLYKKYIRSDRSIDFDKYYSDLRKHTEKLLDESQLTIQISPDAVKTIATTDGRFKTQFETGTSGGSFVPARRKQVENEVMNAPRSMKDADRPIYGLLDDKHGQTGLGAGYGSVKVRLKRSVSDRTTFTLGDSLKDMPLSMRLSNPEPAFIDKPLLTASNPASMADGYTEIQIFGGVSLGDVERIDIADGDIVSPEMQKAMDALESQGINVRVWSNGSLNNSSKQPSFKSLGEFRFW